MKKILSVGYEIWRLIKSHFLPFIAFWLMIFLMRKHPTTALLGASFLNAEVAVRFWLRNGHSHITAFLACVACGNIDLLMWFFFFKKGRYILEAEYPRAGKWFIKKFYSEFDNQKLKTQKTTKPQNWFTNKLTSVFEARPNFGLILIGFTPFLDIILGVPIAVAYKVPRAYLYMAIGNSLKIIILGFILANNFLLLPFSIILLVFWILTKLSPR